MTKITRYIIAGGLLLAAAGVQAATSPALKVYDADVTVNSQAQTLTVLLELNMKDSKVKSNGEAIFTPVVKSASGNDSIELAPFTVCGRNRYYWYMREGAFDAGNPGNIYRAGSKELVKIREEVPLEAWMLENGMVEIQEKGATCCSTPKPVETTPVARLRQQKVTNDLAMDFDYVFTPPKEVAPVEKSIEGKAFVTFVVNRTELNPKYMNNPAEIKKILNSIDLVKADPDAEIIEVHIRGYASPEGPWDNNVRLAKGRTETLAGYVNRLYKFAPGIMTTSYDPEDWGGLRSYVADSMNYKLSNRSGLLSLIDGPLGADAKDAALKSQYPQDYDVILKQIYPWLRHSDYTVRYNIKVYTDIANLMRLYNSDPTKLRAVDFYLIAQQYEVGSPEYIKVIRKAVEVYPDDPELNVNMANIYMQEGNFDAAQSCLMRAQQIPEANFARGVLAAKRGDYLEAEKRFAMAEQEGIPQAGDYLKFVRQAIEFQKERSRSSVPVDILIETTKQE